MAVTDRDSRKTKAHGAGEMVDGRAETRRSSICIWRSSSWPCRMGDREWYLVDEDEKTENLLNLHEQTIGKKSKAAVIVASPSELVERATSTWSEACQDMTEGSSRRGRRSNPQGAERCQV